MKKRILYLLLFLATAQAQAQGVSFSYDAHGNRIKRGSVAVEDISKQEATLQEGFAAALQKLPEAITASSREDKIQVFPNPVSEILQVQVPSTIPSVTLSFYDTNGRLMRAQSSQSGGSTQSIDVSAFPSGTYLFVAGDKGIWRVVKQ